MYFMADEPVHTTSEGKMASGIPYVYNYVLCA